MPFNQIMHQLIRTQGSWFRTSGRPPSVLGFFVIAVACLSGLGSVAAGAQGAVGDPRFSDPNTLLQPVVGQKQGSPAAAPARSGEVLHAPPASASTAGNAAGRIGNAPSVDDGTTNPSLLNFTNFSTMDTLDDKHKLSLGDHLSFRIVEDQEDPREALDPRTTYQTPFLVTDSGDVELPYIGRFPAQGKTCKQLSAEIKAALEKKYYYQATVIIALDQISKTTTGRVYVTGQVRTTGAVEIPSDEVFTLSRAILRAGGFTEYAKKTAVRVNRKSELAGTNVFIVNVSEILEKGKTEHDLKLEPGDLIFVPDKFIVL